jgi:ABC-type xylose transport system substrate-binding protein
MVLLMTPGFRVAFPKGGIRMDLKTLAAAVAVGLLTAGSVAYAQDKGTIGIAMPTKTSARWIADGDNISPRAIKSW